MMDMIGVVMELGGQLLAKCVDWRVGALGKEMGKGVKGCMAHGACREISLGERVVFV